MSDQVLYAVPQILRNDDGVYAGNLVYYGRVLFNHAQNLMHPYHNFRHMFHVLWLCHEACRFYKDVLSRQQMRNLLIAALFHDFDHSGMFGYDDLNIERSIRGLRRHILPNDAPCLDRIASLVAITQYPYVAVPEQLDLCGKILRDADISQAFSVAWIQQVVFGLAAEWRKPPLEVLAMRLWRP